MSEAVERTVKAFVETAVGRKVEPLEARVAVEEGVPSADEFVRLADSEQRRILRENPSAAAALVESVASSEASFPPSVRDELLEALFDASGGGVFLGESSAAALCALCGRTPTDSTRWKALRLLIRVMSAPPSESSRQRLSSALAVDPRVLMPRLLDTAFAMGEWLPTLAKAGLSVDTELVPLRADLLKALSFACAASERCYFAQLRKTAGASAESGTNWLEAGLSAASPPAGTREALAELEMAIDAAIAKTKGEDGGCFVKLDTRSAKDSLALRTRGTLRVCTGAEAVELLGCSKRVAEDVESALASELPLCVAVRTWVPVVAWSEMRSFVCGRKMTALSQYFAARYLPLLLKHREGLVARIRQAFDTLLANQLPYENAVIDWALVGQGDDPNALKLIVLELNPFSRTTGACLFSWVDDFDVLLHGPFCCRFNEDHR